MKPLRPLLYTYRRCPYAMRARMALLVANVAFDAHEIVLRDKPAALLAASPKGTVPVLVLPGGRVLEQSWDIVEWALTQDGASDQVQAWWSRAQTPDNLDLLRCNDGNFKYHLDRYKYPERFAPTEGGGRADTHADHRDRAVAALLQPMEQRLALAPYLGGEQPCASDFGIFPFVRQFAAVDPAWFGSLPLGRVQTWLVGWLHSPLFEACMQKLPSNQRIPFPLRPTAG
jgi:glutathione S-transferase